MMDSWGDGWNGAMYTYTDSAGAIYTGTLASGASGTDAICAASGCGTMVVGGGSYDSEITWSFGDGSGGAPGTFSACI